MFLMRHYLVSLAQIQGLLAGVNNIKMYVLLMCYWCVIDDL